jgi:hypothetical protein
LKALQLSGSDAIGVGLSMWVIRASPVVTVEAGVANPPPYRVRSDGPSRSVLITPAVDKPPTHSTSLWMASARFVA